MKRRTMLGAVAGMASLAGCAGRVTNQSEADSDTAVEQSVSLETSAATAHVELVLLSDGMIPIHGIRARISNISEDALSAILTRHGDDRTLLDNTQDNRTYTWDLSDGEAAPQEFSANADGGDLLVFRVDDGSGEFKSATGRMFDIDVESGGQL